MNPRLTRAEYWLLTRLVIYGQPLRALGLPEGPPWDRNTIDLAYNCQGHGLAMDAFARCLQGAIRKGWIQFSSARHPIVGLGSLSAIRSRLSESGLFVDGVYASLTELGGGVWEAFARPQWDRYIDDCMTYEEDTEAELREVTALDPDWLRRYQATVRAEHDIDHERVVQIADWEMTYWKPRVDAYRWTFRAQGARRVVERPSHYLRSLWCEWQ